MARSKAGKESMGANREGATTSNASSAPDVADAPAKGTLLSSVCHDLRAPLAAVTMGANFVLQTTRNEDPDARSVKILEAMLRSCAQMERLIRNFGDISAIEADAVELRRSSGDASELLDVAAQVHAEAARAKAITIVVRRAEPPIAWSSDRERLQRALNHLVENAVRNAPDASVVTLKAEERDGDVVLSVVDHGPGLSDELRAHLFDRHWLAKQAHRMGAGFGVAVARGFAEVHGGSLDVASEPGKETRFALVLPLHEAAPPKVLANAARPATRSRKQHVSETKRKVPAAAGSSPRPISSGRRRP